MTAGPTAHAPVTDRQARNSQRWAVLLLWWIPLSPLVGFAVAGWLLSASWSVWQVVPLAIILAAPFGAGAYLAWRALRLGGRRPLIGVLLVHGVFLVLALVLPLSESLAGR